MPLGSLQNALEPSVAVMSPGAWGSSKPGTAFTCLSLQAPEHTPRQVRAPGVLTWHRSGMGAEWE